MPFIRVNGKLYDYTKYEDEVKPKLREMMYREGRGFPLYPFLFLQLQSTPPEGNASHPSPASLSLSRNDSDSIYFDFWACQRPLTKKWGSGQVYERICKTFGCPDVAFGKTDNIPENVLYIDKSNGYDWKELPFGDNEFEFGYWDPPYPPAVKGLMKKEGQEIWRCCKKLAILHTYVYPRSWFTNAKRTAMVAVTFGPLKQIRILQIFDKNKTKKVIE